MHAEDDELLSPEELDALEEEVLSANPDPLDMERGNMSNHDRVQGCASCGYDPDSCGCGKYSDPWEEAS